MGGKVKPGQKPAPRDYHVRPPMERMVRIHQALQAGNYPNAARLARELEVSTKSIHRDLEFMRDRLQLPLEYDSSRHGYHYTEEVTGFPTMQVTEGELIALLIAEKALQQYRGTNFEKPLLSAFRKLSASLPDTISVSLSDWEDTISFRTSAEPIVSLEVFDTIARAASRREQIKLAYRKPGRKEAEDRIIDPYHLANIDGEWFLFGFCHMRQDVRTFAPSRIQAVEPTGERFVRRREFSLEKRLKASFGVHAGQEERKIRIRFDDSVADYIREKKWHSSQTLRELPGGGVELGLTLSSVVEVKRWVLGWAGHARVMEPVELAEAVREAARQLLET